MMRLLQEMGFVFIFFDIAISLPFARERILFVCQRAEQALEKKRENILDFFLSSNSNKCRNKGSSFSSDVCTKPSLEIGKANYTGMKLMISRMHRMSPGVPQVLGCLNHQ